MRLICPNCKAQYEVDAAVIPDEGRDVQCSNCGETWFQESERALVAAAELDARLGGDDEAAVPQATPPAPEASASKRRVLDESVVNVLREEAERETARRQAEGSTLETQGDLGLADPVAPAPAPANAEAAASRAQSELEEEATAAAAATVVSRAARRELLPDIEEINSSLRATSERQGEAAAMDAPETIRQRRNGFRRGFFSALAAMLILLLPYTFAAPISRMAPSLAPILSSYSANIDALRVWLDTKMKSTTDSMRSTTQTP